jgi:hypothetical protein
LTVSKTSRALPDISIEDLGLTVDEISGQGLDVIAREGARMILELALNEKMDSFLNRRRYERKAEAPRGMKCEAVDRSPSQETERRADSDQARNGRSVPRPMA